MNSDQKLVIALIIPIVLGILTAAYAYIGFAQNGITSPAIWAATFVAGFYSFVIFFFISMAIYAWRCL